MLSALAAKKNLNPLQEPPREYHFLTLAPIHATVTTVSQLMDKAQENVQTAGNLLFLAEKLRGHKDPLEVFVWARCSDFKKEGNKKFQVYATYRTQQMSGFDRRYFQAGHGRTLLA